MTAPAVPASWLTQPVQVRRYEGEGAYGPVYGPEVELLAYISGSRSLVRNRDGDEVVSEATLHLAPSAQDAVTPESALRFWDRDARAIDVTPHRDPYGRLVYVEVTTT